MTIDFKRYESFVDAVTSDASKDFVNLADRMVELDGQGANIEDFLPLQLVCLLRVVSLQRS